MALATTCCSRLVAMMMPLLRVGSLLGAISSVGAAGASWPCPKEFPFPNTKPNSWMCYNDSAYAKRKYGVPGSWCVDCALSFGPGAAHLPMCSTANITKGCPLPQSPSGLRFSNVFQSAMVLQRDEPLALFGFGAGSEAIEVTLCEQQMGALRCAAGGTSHTAKATVSSESGKWTASMPAQPGGIAPMLLSVGSAGQLAHQLLEDIVFGDVYLFSGQSNIDVAQTYAFTTYDKDAPYCSAGSPWAKPNDPTLCSTLNVTAQNAEEAYATAMGTAGLVRTMIVPSQVPGLNYTSTPAAAAELTDVPDEKYCDPTQADPYVECQINAQKWRRVNGTIVRGFSAVAWFTGRSLLRAAGAAGAFPEIPIGLVRSSMGGTKIHKWSSPAAVAECPQAPTIPPTNDLSSLFNNMILPLEGIRFKAIVWYQGESNVGPAAPYQGSTYYGCALPAMLKGWRETLRLPSVPIIAVELAGYCNEDDSQTYHTWCDETHSKLNTTDRHLPAMRLAQARAETVPNVFVVTAMDLGSIHSPHGSIHPVPKVPLGERIATAMRAAAAPVSAGIVWAGPTATRAAALDGTAVNITFSTLAEAGGIVVDPKMRCPGPILPVFCTGTGFELRSNGAWSAGYISNYGHDHVVVKGAAVSGGVVAADAVRYAFVDWPVPVVRNRVGRLPARPFQLAVTAGGE